MPVASALALVSIFLIWACLLHRFNRTLEGIDPAMSASIGKPSLFWTAFNGHVALVRLIARRDLAVGPYAPMAGQARVLRVEGVLATACLLWAIWAWAGVA